MGRLFFLLEFRRIRVKLAFRVKRPVAAGKSGKNLLKERVMLSMGVDIGARSIDVVLWDGENIVSSRVAVGGANPQKKAMEIFLAVLDDAGVAKDDLDYISSTGYGRNNFALSEKASSEIICHAAGVTHFVPDAKTIVDIGGQDSKVIHLGSDGKVKNFAMNDRCAAGTGKFIEMIAQTLDVPLEEAGELGLTSDEVCEISSMCAVFAESEIVGLVQNGVPVNTILRGVFHSVARRTVSLMGRSVSEGPVVFTGGVALNRGVVEALKTETGREVVVPEHPQLTGALGAAIMGARG